MHDILGEALKDYQQDFRKYKLWIYNKYGGKEEMPVSAYFKNNADLSALECLALDGCFGEVLDVGAAAGSHTLKLQQRKCNVTAMDISAGASQVMRQRGIKKIITADIFSYSKKKFDTLLFLMNGIGLAGTLEGLEKLLHTLQKILKPGGQILFDSSDIAYLYEEQSLPENYYGEIDYRYAYRGRFSEWFKWLYIDKQTMQHIASECGLRFEVLYEDEMEQYLGKLSVL